MAKMKLLNSIVLFAFPALKFEGNRVQFFEMFRKFIRTDFHNVLKNFLFQIAILFAFKYVVRETNWITNICELTHNRQSVKLVMSAGTHLYVSQKHIQRVSEWLNF